MSKWEQYLSSLRCLKCGHGLTLNNSPKSFQSPSVNRELICNSCNEVYPVCEDIPVMFRDPEIACIVINPSEYKKHLEQALKKMQIATRLVGNERFQLKNGDPIRGALSWEILFWEKWKETDQGFVKYDRDKIRAYLSDDTEGGGHLEFFNKVLKFSTGSSDNRILNIGAGRDFLLEEFLDKGFEVVEQDIVFESLLLLKKRSASFCVCCDARFLPFSDRFFDIETCFGSLHHIWPIEPTVRELIRVAKGHIFINEPNYFALQRSALILPIFIKRKLKKMFSSHSTPSAYEKSINPWVLRKIIKKHGAEVLDFRFKRDTVFPKKSNGIKAILSKSAGVIVKFVTIVSAYFEIVARVKGKDKIDKVGKGD